MGFSLEQFFKYLEDIINDSCLSTPMKYALLKEEIENQKKYAKECGQINENI